MLICIMHLPRKVKLEREKITTLKYNIMNNNDRLPEKAIPTKATINIICNNTTIMTDCIDRNNIITQNKKGTENTT